MKPGQSAVTDVEWQVFVRRYRAEMKAPAADHALNLLAEMSRRIHFSVGCYCERVARCHRSILRKLLVKHGAVVG